jgi:hypothetical protein
VERQPIRPRRRSGPLDLSQVLAHHPEWRNAEIKVFDIVSADERDARSEELRELVRTA